jgi:two-component system response regulator AtoC
VQRESGARAENPESLVQSPSTAAREVPASRARSQSSTARILVVDDDHLLRWSLCHGLQDGGHATDQAGTVAEALALIGRDMPDLVLLDHMLPDGSGVEVLRRIRALSPNTPVLMITAHASIHGAVEVIKEGAYDYVAKPFDLDAILLTVARALEAGHLREEVARHREDARRDGALENLVADSEPMREIARMIHRIALSEASTILLLGESGVGKGLVARALHYAGPAACKPFTNITCTALPETLLESELFGHEKGAFTDARVLKKGLFELADGGTVFLDEIGDLSPGLQGKLLRVLEDKSFRRVGGTRDIRVAVRIVAATNKDLAEEVRCGRFRSDLYFRLRVIPLEIPPLRERSEDILPLAESFLQHFNREFRKSVSGFAPAAALRLQAYAWPGNVRELRNAIERAVLLSDGGPLGLRDLPKEISGDAGPGSRGGAAFRLPSAGLVLDELVRDLVVQALERSRGNRTRAAALLGLNRDQIRYRIEKFGLEDELLHSE